MGFPGGASGKETACLCRRCERWGFDPWIGKIPGGGRGSNPLQYSCLQNPMDRGTWQAILQGVAKSQTQLKRLSMYTCMGCKQISAVVTRGLGEGRKAEQMKPMGFFLVCRTQWWQIHDTHYVFVKIHRTWQHRINPQCVQIKIVI